MIAISRLNLFVLTAFWIYFFVYSYRHKIGYPWGFGIVIVGLPLARLVYSYQDNNIIFSINLMLVICLIGLFWNINNIKEQFYIKDNNKILRFIGIGLISGLLFGFVMLMKQEMKYTESSGQYTVFAFITSSIQASVSEEFLITGYFLGYLKKYGFNQILAIACQSSFFVILHVPRYSDDWMAILIVFLVAVVSGYLAWRSNNLIPSFVLHIVANLTGVIWWLAAV